MRREQTLADRITGSAVWRSVVRHGYPDTQRNQALIIASNVFLHIHPVKIKRYATKVTYTFCLGGLSFFMFLVLTMTGVLLMFYYVPSSDQAYQTMKDIEGSVTFAGPRQDVPDVLAACDAGLLSSCRESGPLAAAALPFRARAEGLCELRACGRPAHRRAWRLQT